VNNARRSALHWNQYHLVCYLWRDFTS